MSYYRGDYYRGDYYRGDPGFLSFLGGAAKAIGGFIPGVGPIISGIGEKLSGMGAKKVSTAIVAKVGAGGAMSTLAKMKGGLKGAILKHPVLTGAGAAGVAGAALGALGEDILGGGKMRKRRRMRATNTKALRRALRRAYAFERIAMKTIHLVHPRKKGRFGGFKRPRRRAA